jgi:peptidylprolyl isomerase
MPTQKPTRQDGKMPKGLELEDLHLGDGPKARRGNTVEVRYEIRLSRGELISEGVQRGLILGTRRTFVGFERGIEGMQVGGLRQLRVPPHLAYRDGRLLVCKLELVSIGHYR